MNSLQIEYFLAVAKNLSFSRAAEELFVAQPSVSKQVSSLENELGYKLIDRSNRNHLFLTQAGTIFYELFSSWKNGFVSADMLAKSIGSSSKTRFTVGIVEDWSFVDFINLCLAYFKDNLPEVSLNFESHSFKELRTRLDSGQLDLVLCLVSGAGMTVSEGRDLEVVAEIPSMIALSKDHPLALKGDFDVEQLRDEPLYILPNGEAPHFRDINSGFFLQHNMQPIIREMPNRSSINLAIRSGTGYAFSDAWSSAFYSDDFFTKAVDIKVPICAIWSSTYNRYVVDIFLKLLRQWHAENKKKWE